MNRRQMLKNSMFGGMFLSGGISLVDGAKKSTDAIAAGEVLARTRKTPLDYALTVAFGDIYGSPDFPVRPENHLISDGTIVIFIWPSERGQARAYSRPDIDLPPQELCFRLRMGDPEPPYYLHWHRGDYYLYTCPGALIERAVYKIDQGGEDNVIQALADMRQALILNLTLGHVDSQSYLNRMSDLDRKVRDNEGLKLSSCWSDYRDMLYETNPNTAAQK